jgi:peptidoglycan/LPS O-acetylase OafA/YrhL
MTSAVDFFMVLSGFCLFWPYACQPDRVKSFQLKQYAVRRTRRIIPPYYMSIVFVTLLPFGLVVLWRIVGQDASWPSPATWQDYLTHLTFTHTLFPEYWSGIQGVYWSLGLEAQFYLVFPLVLLGFRYWGLWVIPAIAALSLIYRSIVDPLTAQMDWTVSFLFSITFLGRWMQFAAGMMAAVVVANLHKQGKQINRQWSWVLVLFAGATYVLANANHWLIDWLPAQRDVALACSFALLCVVVSSGTHILRNLFQRPALVGFGVMSYSFFLYHQNFAYYLSELFEKVLKVGPVTCFALMLTIGFAASFMISYLFFLIAEKPFLKPKHMKTSGESVDLTQTHPTVASN